MGQGGSKGEYVLRSFPNGLFHVLPGSPETGAALVKERFINMISFTGSTRAGRLAKLKAKRGCGTLGGL